MQELRHVPVNQAEAGQQRQRIGRAQVLDPAEERLMAHLDGGVEHLVEREEHRDLQHDRQTARRRIDLLAPIELHQLLVHPLAVLAVALLELLHLGLQRLHLAHRRVGLVGQREEQRLDQHRHHQDGQTEIADMRVEPFEQVEQRLGEEPEPAPVDREVELVDPVLLFVVRDHAHDLGAGEQPAIGGRAGARGDGLAGRDIVDLVLGLAGRAGLLDRHVDRLLLVGNEGRHPVLVGDADPAAGGLQLLLLVVLEVGVAEFLVAVVEDAVRAFMQHVGALRRRRAEAHDEAPGEHRHRLVRLVLDALLDGEHEERVDRDIECEDQALAIVPGQPHRLVRRHCGLVGGP